MSLTGFWSLVTVRTNYNNWTLWLLKIKYCLHYIILHVARGFHWVLIYQKKCSLWPYKPKTIPTTFRVTNLRLWEMYSPTVWQTWGSECSRVSERAVVCSMLSGRPVAPELAQCDFRKNIENERFRTSRQCLWTLHTHIHKHTHMHSGLS